MKRTLLALAMVTIANTGQTHDQANCQSIDNLLARLACYDESHGSAKSGAEAGITAVASTAQQPRSDESASSTFGRPTELFAPRDSRTVSAKLARLDSSPGRKTRLVLDNGQIWELSKDRMIAYRGGAAVEIKTGAVGGYLMSVNGSSWFRVKRIDK